MFDRSAYFTSQNARIAWFLGQYLLSNRLSRPVAAPPGAPARRHRPSPTLAELLQDIATLLRKDWRNIRDGIYRAPPPITEEAARLVTDALRYFRDLPDVTARRRRDGFDEVRRVVPGRGFPDYYLRNFHYQTDGYLSERSALLYDQQVEVLFIGSADAMRRQALPPIASVLRRRVGAVVHLDVACGTGRFLATVLDSFPRLRSIGLDLSPDYLAEAKRSLRAHPNATLVRGLAETLPLADGSVDLLTCVYLLHEVPPDVRSRIAGEFGRVLRPGGRVVIVDSLQHGDRPAWDRLLTGFPRSFHEPFYADYAATDLARLFGASGLRAASSELAFLSKIMVFDKPDGT
ncbi:MAG TPA: class I SAM-dependent methyltransferase [Rhodospirillales bacterium]|nr:class I SAM-dependent methyltransferase [Rhodospirillales bacterium]